MAELGDACDVPLMVDWAALEGAGFERSQPVDIHLRRVTVEQALIALLGYCSGGSGIELTYTLHEGAVVVTTVDQQGPYTYAAVYDVRDIPVRGPPPHTVNHGVPPRRNNCFGGPAGDEVLTREEMDEEIASALTAAVSPDLWATAGGSGGSVQALSGRLVVVATWRQHHEIRRILSAFREPHPQ